VSNVLAKISKFLYKNKDFIKEKRYNKCKEIINVKAIIGGKYG